ncbi:hypothetical protein ACWDRR_38580 [Kitasatospora sp. NPDC003701]
MIDLRFSAAGTGGADRGPRGKMDFSSADLYDLTSEAFWGPYTFVVDGADFSGMGPILDLALGFLDASRKLASNRRATYSAAAGAGEYVFERRGSEVRVRRERYATGAVGYEELCTAAQEFMTQVLDGLTERFPDLKVNPEIRRLRRSGGA